MCRCRKVPRSILRCRNLLCCKVCFVDICEGLPKKGKYCYYLDKCVNLLKASFQFLMPDPVHERSLYYPILNYNIFCFYLNMGFIYYQFCMRQWIPAFRPGQSPDGPQFALLCISITALQPCHVPVSTGRSSLSEKVRRPYVLPIACQLSDVVTMFRRLMDDCWRWLWRHQKVPTMTIWPWNYCMYFFVFSAYNQVFCIMIWCTWSNKELKMKMMTMFRCHTRTHVFSINGYLKRE